MKINYSYQIIKPYEAIWKSLDKKIIETQAIFGERFFVKNKQIFRRER